MGPAGPTGPAGTLSGGTTGFLAAWTSPTALGSSTVFDNGSVGIGTTNPQATLDVNGGLRIANTAACGAGQAGTIRWNGTDFEGCNGGAWVSLTAGGGSGAAPSGLSQAQAAASCNAIKLAYPASGSGSYWLNPNGGSTADAYQATCEMTTDGGGWTRVFLAGSLNYNQNNLNYTLDDLYLRNDAVEAMIAYVDGSGVILPNYARFGLPSQWKLTSPFAQVGTDVAITLYLNGAIVGPQTLRFGYQSFSTNCQDGWNTASSWGRICVYNHAQIGNNSVAPFYNTFAGASTDSCSTSNQAYSTTPCSASRVFTIWVR